MTEWPCCKHCTDGHMEPHSTPCDTCAAEPAENDAPAVRLALTERDARFAVEHLRLLAEREKAITADHAAANLSARWLADRIERAL